MKYGCMDDAWGRDRCQKMRMYVSVRYEAVVNLVHVITPLKYKLTKFEMNEIFKVLPLANSYERGYVWAVV